MTHASRYADACRRNAMGERSRAAEQNLTGVWHGLYRYADGTSVSFVATLIQSGGSITGSTHEPSIVGGKTASAMLAGSRHAGSVTFVKTYDRAGPIYCNPIHYDGALNGDATEIEGRWTISRILSGKFLMIRSTGKAEAVVRKDVQRA
jgi:hypothetical protein